MATNTDKTSGIDREKIREETRALAFDEIDRLAAEEVSISKTKRIGGEGVVLDREKIREEVRDEAFGQIDRLAAEIPVSAEPSPASRIPEKWEDLPADLQKLKDEVLPLFRKYYAGTMIEVIQGREEVNKLGIRTGDLYSTASERSDRIQDELRQHFESLDPQTPNQIYVERLMNRLNDQAIEEAESETGLSWVEAQRMLNERERKREEAGRRRMPSPEPPRVPEPASPPSGPEPPAQPVPPPRREPTPEKTSEEAWNVLKEARTAYAEAYRKHQHSHKERLGFLRKIIFEIKGGEYPGDDFLAQVKAKYDEAKLVYGQALRREGVEAGQIFKEVIIAEKLSLQKEQIETLPPKEKNLLGKAWDLWNRQSRYTKVGVSVFIATGAFASAPLVMAGATGFTSISAALLFAGQRFIRAAAISSPIVAGFFERTGEFFFSEGKTQDRKEQAISRLQSKFSLDAIGAADEEYGQILREEARRQKMKFAVKAGGLVVAGSGLGLLTYYHGGGLVGRGGIRPSMPQETPPVGVRHSPSPGIEPSPRPTPGVRTLMPGDKMPRVPESPIREVEIPKGVMPAEVGKSSAEAAPPENVVPTREYLSSTKIEKGEGVWHGVYRILDQELKGDLKEFNSRFGKFGVQIKPEDLENPVKLKRILNKVTGKLLVEQGYMNDVELRVTRPGVEIILNSDDTISFGETGRVLREVPRGTVETVGGARVEPDSVAPETPEYQIHEPGRSPLGIQEERGIRSFEAPQPLRDPLEPIPGITDILSSGQREILEHTFNRNLLVRDELLEAGLDNIANQIQRGKLGVEHFNEYLWENKFIAEPLPRHTVENFKHSFKIIGGSNEAAKKVALESMRDFLKRIIKQ